MTIGIKRTLYVRKDDILPVSLCKVSVYDIVSELWKITIIYSCPFPNLFLSSSLQTRGGCDFGGESELPRYHTTTADQRSALKIGWHS